MLRTSLLRMIAYCVAGAAALLAVTSLGAEIDDVSALFGVVPVTAGYQRLASHAAADCGALGAERESCEMSVIRLAARRRQTPGVPMPARAQECE